MCGQPGRAPSGGTGDTELWCDGHGARSGHHGRRVQAQDPRPSEFVVRHITIQPGGSTGWHYHPGTLLAVVQQGSLTRIDDDCRAVVYSAGQSLVEPSGSRHVHIGRNLGSEPVELYVTYVKPIGSPLSVDAADPGCGGRGDAQRPDHS